MYADLQLEGLGIGKYHCIISRPHFHDTQIQVSRTLSNTEMFLTMFASFACPLMSPSSSPLSPPPPYIVNFVTTPPTIPTIQSCCDATYVNGVRLTRGTMRQLHHADAIVLGVCAHVFVFVQPATKPGQVSRPISRTRRAGFSKNFFFFRFKSGTPCFPVLTLPPLPLRVLLLTSLLPFLFPTPQTTPT